LGQARRWRPCRACEREGEEKSAACN